MKQEVAIIRAFFKLKEELGKNLYAKKKCMPGRLLTL